ncbi:DUF2461 domain-containing protein [uncultured Bacteroides sp.]|uniref:DUF2461 domain-containing protein n=1 Tax=uncultured Bacteroides sp. TaxID=162156 RepID=UPI00261290D5|nr:DUF2461 domain-containing protein [uncultured Bacteroides sp.]
MEISDILDFLKRLSRNNNREWFQEHKSEYDAAKERFDELLSAAIFRISQFDDTVAHLQPKDCTYRIYRDIRFSSDKTPYKNYISGYINPHGKKADHCGYYIHLEPGNCMLAGGSWCLPPKMLKALRESVVDNIDEFRSIVEDPEFKKFFPTVGEEHLKTIPKGFPKDFPYPEYIKCKDYIISCHIPDSFYDNPHYMDEIVVVFKQLKRFADFTNYTIDDFEY